MNYTLSYLIFKASGKLFNKLLHIGDYIWTRWVFIGNRVDFKTFKTNGIPFVSVSKSGTLIIDGGLKINNGLKGNPIGPCQPCVFFVGYNAKIIIGKNVGLSSTALVSRNEITIGDNVKMGSGVCIYDTDFHSLNASERLNINLDFIKTQSKSVNVGNNVFIGAHSIILKGVHIGENSIIGASSVVTKSIPKNQIWAGNPAKYIKQAE